MAADTYNFPNHIKGDTFRGVIFEVLVNGVAVDLTAYTIKMHLRPNAASATLSLNLTSSIEKHDPTNGKFRINAVKIDIAPRTYYYDIEFTEGTTVRTWVSGTWTVVQDVTDITRT
jgi:hypothetical protein